MNDPQRASEQSPNTPPSTVMGDGPSGYVGTVIGPYKLMEQIGEGGFGLVFVAEQLSPVRRKVAIKVIKPGMDTRDVIARFEAERQALAMMDHPNIARVLDAGATDAGRPYFVMELVRGVPITDYCDRSKLTPRERLELFVVVCQAVQHAHQKGIIHRDIKPSNVLVTLHDGRPLVKVIDFGVAKALHQQLTEKTIYTRFAQMVGTPLYMSPEQAEMSSLDIDTRTDIYSLGVLMYELLTGTTPFDKKRVAKAAYDELIRMIRDEEPPKPSTRLSQSTASLPAIAGQRNTEPARLSKMFRGDLDWITMKALEKDRTRRYETASSLAADVVRYLHDEPVEASPPSTRYRLRKFARRYRAPLMTAAAFAGVLLAAAIGSAWLAVRAMHAEWTANESLQAEINARNEADTQRRVADEQRKLTQVQKERADASAAKAETERDAKGLALERAEALRLTAQSSATLSSNPGLALLLAIEGAKRARPRLATHNNALLAALNECRERRTILASSLDPGTERGAILSGLCISHDGRLLATTSVPQSRADFVSNDNAARVFSAATGAQVSFFRVAGLIPSSCEFSPDDRLVVSTFEGAALIKFKEGARRIYSDRAARVWDAATGREVAVLKGHTDRVISAHFSSDDRRIVTASWDGTARVWDTRTGQSLGILRCGQLGLASASFSLDASRILTVSSSSGISRKTTVDETHRDIEWDPPLRGDHLEAQVMQLALSLSSTTRLGPGYGGVRIWNAASGAQLYVLEDKAETGAVCAAFSPDGRQAATGLWRGTIKIWDAQTGTLTRSWKGPTERISSVAYSPDGNRLLLVYGDVMENRTSLAVWSALDRREITRWGEASFPTGIGTAQLSPDARQVLVLPGNAQHKGQPKTVSLRSVTEAAGAEGDVTIFKGQEGKVAAVQFNFDGREAVTAGSDGTLRIWTCRGPGIYGTLLDSSSGPIGQAAFDSKGRFVLTTYGLDRSGGIDSNRSVRLWDVRSRGLLHTIKPGLPRHPGPASAAFLGVLQAFVNPAHIADMPIAPFFEQFILGEILHAEFSRDGNRVLTISDDSHVRRHVDSPPKQSKQQGDDDDVPGTPIQTLRSGADVDYGPVRVWDVASGKKLIQLKGFTANVRSASLSPDGRRIVTVADNACKYVTLDNNEAYRSSGWATGPKDPAIRIWDAETGRQIAALEGPANRAYGASWSPDGRFLFSATSDLSGTIRIRLWDAQTLNNVREFKASRNTLGWSAGQPLFSPDSRHLILLRTDGDSKVATIWDVDRAAGPVELRGHLGRINDGAFSPTGSRVVTASDDGTARVWNPATGEQVLVLRGHENGLHSARFSPDSRWIVTASSDATARVWYAETAREYLTLASHRGPVLEASFSPDSQSVVTASGDRTARIWPIDPLPVAISRRPRDFTTREREMFEVGR